MLKKEDWLSLFTSNMKIGCGLGIKKNRFFLYLARIPLSLQFNQNNYGRK